MAPVIWGLDLAEIKWSKFKSSYMWNNEYHLRRTKFIVYQCALILCVVSESLGTDVLSDYIQMERKIQTIDRSVYVSNNDYVGAGSYNIFAGVFIAFIFGAAFFFDLIWPERHESKGVRIAWKVCGVLSVVFHLADAITLTVITFSHRSYIVGANAAQTKALVSLYSKASEAPLIYAHNNRAIAAVAFVWPGTLSVIGSCILLFLSIDNVEFGPGPKSKHARLRDGIAAADPEYALSATRNADANHTEKETTSEPEKDESSLSPPMRDSAPAMNAAYGTSQAGADYSSASQGANYSSTSQMVNYSSTSNPHDGLAGAAGAANASHAQFEQQQPREEYAAPSASGHTS